MFSNNVSWMLFDVVNLLFNNLCCLIILTENETKYITWLNESSNHIVIYYPDISRFDMWVAAGPSDWSRNHP